MHDVTADFQRKLAVFGIYQHVARLQKPAFFGLKIAGKLRFPTLRFFAECHWYALCQKAATVLFWRAAEGGGRASG